MNPDDLRIEGPFAAGDVTYPAGASFGPRVMRDFEFVWIIQGDIEYRWGSRVFSASDGAVLLCRPGATDFFRWDPAHATRHAYFHFTVERFPAEWPAPHDWAFVRPAESADILLPLFRHVLSYTHDDQSAQRRLAVALMLTAFVTGNTAVSEPQPAPLPDSVARALSHIQATLSADPAATLPLKELASVAFVTPEHLCRQFKIATGRTPAQTVRLARLDQAAALLSRSNYSVKEIAYMCGFATPFHLSRVFKAGYGMSPTAMRTAVRSGEYNAVPLLSRYAR